MGDLNARIGKFSDNNLNCRQSKDKVINARGKSLINLVKQYNLIIMNGNSKKDKSGDFTFINRNGSSVIDVCLTNLNTKLHKLNFSVGISDHSCHFPISLDINIQINKPMELNRVEWDTNKCERYRDDLDNLLQGHETDFIPIELFQKYMLHSITTNDMFKTRILSTNRANVYSPRWFDTKCIEAKKVKNKALRTFRTSNDSCKDEARNLYLNMLRSYKNLIRAKKIRFYKSLEHN
jgi:retrotransposon-encoded endonuclease